MMQPIIIGTLLFLGTLPAWSQTQDSVLFYTKGNIAGRVFEVEEILVRPTCQCVGDCCCASNGAEHYSTNRFLTTDAVLTANSRVALIRRGNYAMEPVLNGMASDRLNLTIDGMKIFGACTDKMDPVTSYVEPNNMKAISVQHGASGSMFGSSMGGSVNMETNGATLDAANKLSGELGAGFHSAAFGGNGLMSLNYGRKRWAVRVNGMYRKAGNYRSGGGEMVDFSQYEKWNGALAAKFMATERDMLRFDLIVDEAYNVGYPALPMDVLHAKAGIYGLTHTHFPVAEWFEQLETKLYVNNVAHSMDDTKRPNVAMHMDMPGRTHTYGGYMNGRLRFGKHGLVVRLDGFHSNARAEMTMYPDNDAPMFMLTWPDVDRLNLGLFLQDHIRLNEKRSLGINARVEYTGSAIMDEFGVRQASIFHQNADISDHRLLKNASISYQEKLKGDMTVFVTTGYAERAPSITEQYGFYIFNAYDGFDHVGNRDVLTEKALQADAGVRWERKKFTVNVSGFYYYMMDYILAAMDSSMDAMTIGANGVKVTENLSSAMMTGASADLGYRPWKFLQLTSTLSYTYGSTYDGTPLPLVPPLRATVAAKYIYEKGWVQLDCETHAAQHRTSPAFGERTTPAYAILNLRAGHVFKLGTYGLSLHGGIENLLDTHYRNHLDWGGIPRPGINGFLNLSFSF